MNLNRFPASFGKKLKYLKLGQVIDFAFIQWLKKMFGKLSSITKYERLRRLLVNSLYRLVQEKIQVATIQVTMVTFFLFKKKCFRFLDIADRSGVFVHIRYTSITVFRYCTMDMVCWYLRFSDLLGRWIPQKFHLMLASLPKRRDNILFNSM
jgi:hypothetical protein